jgi:uncharacterized membrane protein
MATTKPAFSDELAQYNDSLASSLRGYGMTLRTFKFFKLLMQLAGIAAGVYAMSLGAAPLATFAMVTVIILGPEGLELFIEANGGGGDAP